MNIACRTRKKDGIKKLQEPISLQGQLSHLFCRPHGRAAANKMERHKNVMDWKRYLEVLELLHDKVVSQKLAPEVLTQDLFDNATHWYPFLRYEVPPLSPRQVVKQEETG